MLFHLIDKHLDYLILTFLGSVDISITQRAAQNDW